MSASAEAGGGPAALQRTTSPPPPTSSSGGVRTALAVRVHQYQEEDPHSFRFVVLCNLAILHQRNPLSPWTVTECWSEESQSQGPCSWTCMSRLERAFLKITRCPKRNVAVGGCGDGHGKKLGIMVTVPVTVILKPWCPCLVVVYEEGGGVWVMDRC